MTLRNALLLSLAVTCMLVLVGSAAAVPNNYGTGIHKWVLHCGPYSDGHSTHEIVSSSICPQNPPPMCRCERTKHDFPYNNIYQGRVSIGFEEENPSTVKVKLDTLGAIQCGIIVDPPSEPYGTCGDPWLSFRAEEWEVEGEILDLVNSLLPGIEDDTGVPVEDVQYYYALPLGTDY